MKSNERHSERSEASASRRQTGEEILRCAQDDKAMDDKAMSESRRPRGGRRPLIALALLLVAAAVCITYSLWTWSDLRRHPLRPLELSGEWIQAAGDNVYSGCFRREIMLPGRVRNAWLVVAACDGFEASVNGRPIGWDRYWRPTRPFQVGISETGQRINWPQSALALNYAREYQWEDHGAYRVPMFMDLTRQFRGGKNVVCVEVQSRRAPAKALIDGAIELWNGTTISLASGPEWRAEPVPPVLRHADWRSRSYEALSWRNAVVTEAPPGRLYRTFDPRIYTTALRGQWLRHPAATAQESIWFETELRCEAAPAEAWIRIAANRNFTVVINGRRLFVDTANSAGMEDGEWLFDNAKGTDSPPLPEQLHPDLVGAFFVRRHVDLPAWEPEPEDEEEVWVEKPPLTAAERNAKGREGGLQTIAPKTVHRELGMGAYVGYNISGLIHSGRNTIAVRLDRPLAAAPAGWPAQLASDGELVYSDGSREAFASDGGWRCWRQEAGGGNPNATAALAVRPGAVSQFQLCSMRYDGVPCYRELLPDWANPAWMAATVALLGATLLLGIGGMLARDGKRPWSFGSLACGVGVLPSIAISALLPLVVVLGSMLLLSVVFNERSEMLWFLAPNTWLWGLVAAGIFAIVGAGVRIVTLSGGRGVRAAGYALRHFVRELPKTRTWLFLILWISLAGLVLRIYALDFQPLDDDEYPSLQAILSVAETGIPSYVPDPVWYTRSPLFHYLTGGSVWLFGANMWAIRLPTALFGVATGILFYLCGARLLRRPWVGMAALILATMHPNMIFTSHMVRFYQQQQFFALWMAYCFCKGFVLPEQSQRYRYLTIVAFLGAALSQEITSVAAVQLAIGYVLFAEKKTLREDLGLLLAAVCAVAIILVDWVIYETHCLTRLEGYSPSIQADFQPHVWDPYNVLTLFLGYSRLHVLLSAAFFLGLPAALRERNRVSYALHFLLFSGIVMVNLLVTQVSIRYQYWLMPLLMILAVDNARAGLAWLGSLSPGGLRRRMSLGFVPGVCLSVVVVGIVLSWSPWRIPSTYDTKMLGDSTGSLRYIRSQLRPGDMVMATQPHAKAALIEIGQSDYELHVPIIYDFVLLEEGRLIDRGAGADVVASLKQLQQIVTSHNRVWLAVNREKMRSRGKGILWQYPGARVELYLRKNFQLKYQNNLWCVYLWDANQGYHRPFRHSGA